MIARKAIKSKTFVLTFDDGPGNKLTPRILKLLDEYKVKATFFLLGRNIAGREQIVRQIAAKGHEIGSHGYDHLHHWKVSPVRAIRDIKQGWKAIDIALGTNRGRYPFRPPYGKMNLVSLFYLWVKKVPIIYWTVDSGDTWAAEKRDVYRAVTLTKIEGGAVVLAHDFDRTKDDTNKIVLDSISLVLSAAKEKGMKVVALPELVGRGWES